MTNNILKRIKLVDFPENQYIRKETKKTQIYLHHTAGSSSPFQVIDFWESNPERIATSFIVAGRPPGGVKAWYDGQIVQAFSSKYWGQHLGVKQSAMPPGSPSSIDLQRNSIGIEITNWGWLKPDSEGRMRTYINSIVPDNDVIDLGIEYRGFRYWHSYTDAQLQSVRDLLVLLCQKWNIPKKFKGNEMFNLNNSALMGEPGIWSHTSVRKDKTDVYPHPKLIEMLKSL